MKFIKCTNHSCSNSNPPITLDSADDVGLTSSIAIGTDGLPVISYYDSTNGNLKLIKCTNINCNGANNPIILDDAESVGTFSSIAIGTNDLPIISYRDLLNQNLKVVNCTNVSCSNSSAPITINSEGNVGAVDSMIIGSDGRPIISYIDSDSSALKIAKCLSRDCFFTVIFSTLDSLIIPGYFTSIGLSNDGLPVISYVERSKGAIKVYSCADVDCKK